MGNFKYNAKSGFYRGHYCRSLGEFHVALYLDLIDGATSGFKTEPFALRSEVTGKKKIPDFASLDKCGFVTVWEIKPDKAECDEVEALYRSDFSYVFEMPGMQMKFVDSSKFTKKVKQVLSALIGAHAYDKLLHEYKSQTTTYTGFPGELNPMFGKTHSYVTRRKISMTNTGKQSGIKNGMYGRTHSDTSKIVIGEKWHDIDRRNETLRAGLLNRLGKLTDDQYDDYVRSCIAMFSGSKVSNPKYMNGITKITCEKVTELFGTYRNFWDAIRVSKD